jgi:hypothetical protein
MRVRSEIYGAGRMPRCFRAGFAVGGSVPRDGVAAGLFCVIADSCTETGFQLGRVLDSSLDRYH